MRRVIVTGANGFIGSAVVKELIRRNYDVIAVVHKNSNRLSHIPNLRIVRCDMNEIASLPSLIDEGKIDYFLHLAWEGVNGKDRGNYLVHLNNVKCLLDAIVVSEQLGCSRFISSGSIMEKEAVYALSNDGDRPGPSYIYGVGKNTAHSMATIVAAEHNIELVWAIVTNAYGPGEISTRLLNSTIRKCMEGVDPEFTDASQNYDFVFIDDVARAFCLLAEKGKPFCEYVIGSSNAQPLKNFLLDLQNTFFPERKFIFGKIPFSGRDMPLTIFDSKKTEVDTGFKAEISFNEGCRLTIEWLNKFYYKDGGIDN